MFSDFQPFGHEVSLLNDTITTATNKQFNLQNRPLVKSVIRLTGLPHFGARLRAYYLRKLLLNLPANQSILDAGCGMGLNSFLALRCGHRVHGVDTDTEKLRLANMMRRGLGLRGITFSRDNLTDLSLPDNTYDATICFEVMEHIDEDTKAFKEIARVLKKKGTLYLSVPAKGVISKINQASKDHVREGYSFDEIESLLSTNNMNIESVIKIERTPLGFIVRYLNDEIGRRSLGLVTILFPLFLPLGILDGYLPETISPSNWIIVAQKDQ